MGLSGRLGDVILRSRVPLDRVAVERAVTALAATEAPLARPDELRRVVDDLVGLGPIEPLLADPEVTDVLINGPAEVWVDRRGALERTDVVFAGDAELLAIVERTINALGLRLDRAAPIVDARLSDGSRLHAVIPPATPDHPLVAIRRFSPAIADLDGLVEAGAATPTDVVRLRELVRDRRNLLVAGGTGTGKTTLLNVLSKEIDPGERVVVVEDAAELTLGGHVVRLEAQPANAEGAGGVGIPVLLRAALRLRPDRIVLGEVRGPEALDLLTALNTGHAGSMSTVHANSPEEALWRLETLALSGDRRVSEEAVRRQLSSAVHVVIQLERRAGIRRIAGIEERRT